MFALVGERGYGGVSARSVSERAGVSSRTFYEFFSDREDCFLAAFDYAVAGLEVEARAGWESQLGWTARVRGALGGLLLALDRERAVRRLVFVEALVAGPRVLACRARLLERLAGVVDQGRVNANAPASLPPLVAEGLVGAAFGVIHARVLESRRGPLVELTGALMAMIVLPYRGSAAATRELAHPTQRTARGHSAPAIAVAWPLGVDSLVDYRLTARAQMALAAVAGRPGLSNREVCETIGLADEGQISRMMKRLQEQGLVENTPTPEKRFARAWRLTAKGEAVIDAYPSLKRAQRKTSRGGKLSVKSTRRGKYIGQRTPRVLPGQGTRTARRPGEELRVPRPFRLTLLTHQVLTAVATLSEGETNPSNRDIANLAGVKDEGQISKLLARLQAHGLLQNTGGVGRGAPNAWQLTPRGKEYLSASRPATPEGAQ
ncbi:MAG TPA: TetR family transcriptional regulator [Solirubrobacteraceae bacterium]